jgi:hypothetical protein
LKNGVGEGERGRVGELDSQNLLLYLHFIEPVDGSKERRGRLGDRERGRRGERDSHVKLALQRIHRLKAENNIAQGIALWKRMPESPVRVGRLKIVEIKLPDGRSVKM